MGKRHTHKKGSRAFRPRKRAVNQMPRVNFWPTSQEKKLLGFAGYKAGMTTISFIDDTTSPNAGNEVFIGATVIEAPEMVIYGVRGFSGKINAGDILCNDEKVMREIGVKVKSKNELKAESLDEVFVLAYTNPSSCSFGKKAPERMMIAVGGKDASEKLEYAKSLLGKTVKASDVFKAGDVVDSISVTKGKGWQGPVKRFGTNTQRRKATGKVRHTGTLGAWHPGYVQYTVPMAGQTGYHKRTEINKRVMKVVAPGEVSPKGGFMHYGPVKNECILILGSVAGPTKRLIRMRKAGRKQGGKAPDVKSISTESKQ